MVDVGQRSVVCIPLGIRDLLPEGRPSGRFLPFAHWRFMPKMRQAFLTIVRGPCLLDKEVNHRFRSTG